jgi:alginate O-acetyltransferase complex protein AlgI
VITTAAFWIGLPAAAFVHWRLKFGRDWFLFLASAGFLAFHDPAAIVALLLISSLCYVGAQLLKGSVRWLNWTLILVVVGYLAYHKYLPPLVAVIQGSRKATAADLAVPLGVSYFTFKLIHYVVDASRKTLPKHGPAVFFAWVFFLPMFAAGPIERFEHFVANRATTWKNEYLLQGGTRIVYGLVKKFVLVDLLLTRTAKHVPDNISEAIPIFVPAFSAKELVKVLPDLHPLFAWQFVINHFAAAYVDFSAYNDIALGTALLFGVKLTENFDWPIAATNPPEFWRRWHISLSAWCQRYVYFPTMAATRRPYLAIYATMITMGLWHEGTLSFLVRGLYWGTLIVIFVTWGRVKRSRRWKGGHWALTWTARGFMFLAAAAAMAFTATHQSFSTGLRLFATLFGFHLG